MSEVGISRTTKYRFSLSKIAQVYVKMSKKNVESQPSQEDLEVMLLMEAPFSTDQEKKKTNEIGTHFNLLDLLYNIWNPSWTATRNLRLLLVSLSMMKSAESSKTVTNFDTRGMRKALKDLYQLWLDKGSLNPTSSADEMHRFIRAQIPDPIYEWFTKNTMNVETYTELVIHYKTYIASLPLAAARQISASRKVPVVTNHDNNNDDDEDDDDDDDDGDDNDGNDDNGENVCENDDAPLDLRMKKMKEKEVATATATATAITSTVEEKEDKKRKKRNDSDDKEEEVDKGRGLDALFDLAPDFHVKYIQQYVSRLNNGRMETMRSPGESGHQLVRLDLYDFKDIVNVDKRHWWRHAKLRSQFFISSSMTDRKGQLLRELLDQVATDMSTIPAIVKETKSLHYYGGQGDI